MFRDLFNSVRAAAHAALTDAGFRQELLEQSVFAAGVIGGIQVLLAILLAAMDATAHAALTGMLLLGAVTWLSSRHPSLYPWARILAVGSCWIWFAILALAAPGALCVPMAAAMFFSAATLIPLTLRQAVGAFVPLLALEAVAPLGGIDRWLLAAVAATSVAVAVAHSVHRWSLYSANMRLVQSTQDLRLVQARALSAEHAASLERLAAALSHELNNPVGALKSAVETLQQLRARYEEAAPERRPRLERLQGEVLGNVIAAAARIHEIVSRLQRFSSLDRATVRPTDMNLVLRDVVAMIEAGQNPNVEIALDLQPVPLLLCETQAWNTIFTTLVTSALRQCPSGGVLSLTSGHRDDQLFVEIAMPSGTRDQANGVDPGFVAEGGRVGTGNWSLFHVRMWIQQQGATLRQTTDPERGLLTRVSIPAGTAARVAAG